MTTATILKSIFIVFSIVLFACNQEKKSNSASKTIKTKDSMEVNNSKSFLNMYKTSANVGPVYHYTCPKGCEGGAGAAGNCSNCGTTLTHNAAFHNASNKNSSFDGSMNQTPANTTNNKPSNNSGVFHYICENGCAGGAASAGNCSTCGNALAHNAAYHN